jgi:hypothetical protein
LEYSRLMKMQSKPDKNNEQLTLQPFAEFIPK